MTNYKADFVRNGYITVANALSPDEVARLNQAIDSDREASRLWVNRGGGRIQNANLLMTTDAFDTTITHPSVLPIVEELVGPDLCFEEFSAMIREPVTADPPEPGWHRDTGHGTGPLAILNLSLIYYLTDVDETTHCFSIVPETLGEKRERPDHRDGDRAVDLHGPAGTAILFNASNVHDARRAATDQERRTIHIYFGHSTNKPLSNHTIFPRRLQTGAHSGLFARLNDISTRVHSVFDEASV